MAPVAASVFAGTTAWATAHDPTAAGTATKTAKPTHTVDPAVAKLRQRLHTRTREIAHMRRSVATLHRRAKRVANEPIPVFAPSTGSGYSSGYSSGGTSTWSGTSGSSSSGSSGSSSAGSSSGGSTTPVAPAPPPPPPPTHTSTGASAPPP